MLSRNLGAMRAGLPFRDSMHEFAERRTGELIEAHAPLRIRVVEHGEGARMAEILVVDDSKVMRDMIIACLRPEPGLAFVHAASGLEAIERLSLKKFDLVLLDLNMPDIGGLEVVEFVRGQDQLRTLPVVIVTTRGDEDSRVNALGAGADRFLTKPFTPEVILGIVRELLASGPR
jgi:two-component system, chemotaxis family, chemotaxis protein CheY